MSLAEEGADAVQGNRRAGFLLFVTALLVSFFVLLVPFSYALEVGISSPDDGDVLQAEEVMVVAFASEKASCELFVEESKEGGVVEHMAVGEEDWKRGGDGFEVEWLVAPLKNGEYAARVLCDSVGASASFKIEDAKPPRFSRSSPQLLRVEGVTARIRVEVDEPSRFTLLLSKREEAADAMERSVSSDGFSTEAELEVDGLDPRSLYWFRVEACDVNGQCSVSSPFTFQTRNAISQETLEMNAQISFLDSDALVSVEHGWGRVGDGERVSIVVEDSLTAIREVVLTFREAASGVKLYVQTTKKKPAGMKTPSFDVLEFWRISGKSLEDASKVVAFRAPKKWARENDLSETTWVVYRYSDEGWKKEGVVQDREDRHFVYARAFLSDAGWFALGALKKEDESLSERGVGGAVDEGLVDEAPRGVQNASEEEEHANESASVLAEGGSETEAETSLGGVTGRVVAQEEIDGRRGAGEQQVGLSVPLLVLAFVVVGSLLAGAYFFFSDMVKLRHGFDTSGEFDIGKSEYEERMEQMEEFIAKAAARGLSRDVIREKLVSAGWNEHEVEHLIDRYLL